MNTGRIRTLLALLIIWGVSQAGVASTVFVARRGWHVDVGLEVAELAPPLASAAAALPGARYLFFGFGDRHYLLAQKHNAPVLLAALWPGAGMMLVTALSAAPEQGFGTEQVLSLELSAEQMQALQSFIWKSLDTPSGALRVYAPGPYADSVYFAASIKYSALRTCNTWVAQALRAAGLRIHPAGVLFAGQVWSRVRRLKRTQLEESEQATGQTPAGRRP
ncbi:MAG TPA: DUF2459 domain-containing protein [Steroidobacteraceae bacterium]